MTPFRENLRYLIERTQDRDRFTFFLYFQDRVHLLPGASFSYSRCWRRQVFFLLRSEEERKKEKNLSPIVERVDSQKVIRDAMTSSN